MGLERLHTMLRSIEECELGRQARESPVQSHRAMRMPHDLVRPAEGLEERATSVNVLRAPCRFTWTRGA